MTSTRFVRRYALESKGPLRLEVVSFGVDDAQVLLDGIRVHTVTNSDQLIQGIRFRLPDGTLVTARIHRLGFDIRRDGRPLSGSPFDPATSFGVASKLMFWIFGVGLILDLLHMTRPEFDPFVVACRLIGDVLMLVLAVLTRRGARWALGVAVVMLLSSVSFALALHRPWTDVVWPAAMFILLAYRFAVSGHASLPASAGPDPKATT